MRSQHEENQNQRQHQRRVQVTAFAAQLARLAGVVHRETFRQNPGGFVFEETQGAVERDVGRDGALDFDRVQLLEPVNRPRLDRLLQRGERGQPHQFAVGTADV